jgi:hypothetical protein
MKPWRCGIQSQQQLAAAGISLDVQNHRIPAGLMDLVHPSGKGLLPDFLQNGSHKKRIKCHKNPPKNPRKVIILPLP